MRKKLNTPADAEALAKLITDSARWMGKLRFDRDTRNFEMAWALLDAAGRAHG